MDSDIPSAIAYLYAGAQANGVASLRVDDGQIFIFSADTLARLLEKANTSSEKCALVFVKAGGNSTPNLDRLSRGIDD